MFLVTHPHTRRPPVLAIFVILNSITNINISNVDAPIMRQPILFWVIHTNKCGSAHYWVNEFKVVCQPLAK